MNNAMHVALAIDVLGMAQTPVNRQVKVFAVSEEVGRAEEALKSGWGPTDGDRACIEGTDKDLASFRRPLSFLHVSANFSGIFLCISHLFGIYGVQFMLNFSSIYIRQHICPAVRRTRVRGVARLKICRDFINQNPETECLTDDLGSGERKVGHMGG